VRARSLTYVAVASAILALAGTAGAGRPALQFDGAKRAYQGKPYAISLQTKQTGTCTLKVKYADGQLQQGITASRGAARVTFRWTVPELAAPGAATLTARCGSKSATQRVTVVGTLIPPRIVVVKSGYSVRTRQLGSTVSYGVVLKNTSPNANALKVSIQVNFVMADSHLVGTATQQIPVINAGSTYNYAGSLGFPGAAPVAKLEFVIIVGNREKAKAMPNPTLSNVAWVAQQFDPAWTAWVQGEVINSHPSFTLRNTLLSAVFFDAQGNVIGGATGSAYNVLPPGTREVFKLTNSVEAVPYAKVASVAVSTIPTWDTTTP
jgi:hypothetical protein